VGKWKTLFNKNSNKSETHFLRPKKRKNCDFQFPSILNKPILDQSIFDSHSTKGSEEPKTWLLKSKKKPLFNIKNIKELFF